MPYQPLTEAQFNKAVNAGYSPQEITQFELQRKQEIETLETPKAKKTLGGAIMGAANAVTDFVGARGIADQYGADIARARAPQEQKNLVEYPKFKEVAGSALQTGTLLIPGAAGAKLGAKAAAKVGGTGFKAGATNYGTRVGFGAAQGYGLDVGAGLQAGEENPYAPGAGTAIGGALPVAGGLLNLAKAGVKKAAPATLEFTSGIPREAIKTAMERPEAARVGRTQTNLTEIRNKAAGETTKLRRELGNEFSSGLEQINKSTLEKSRASAQKIAQVFKDAVMTDLRTKGAGEAAEQIAKNFDVEKVTSISALKKMANEATGGLKNFPVVKEAVRAGTRAAAPLYKSEIGTDVVAKSQKQLFEYAKNYGREFRLGFKKNETGETIVDFSKSKIVKAGERANVQEAISTISSWDDWTPSGLQGLAEKMGALRNFESGATNASSPILGKIYNKLSSRVIKKSSPELANLRTNFSKNKRVLDDIENLLTVTKDNPKQIQTTINSLNQIFRDDKETYVNVIRELSNRSGVDILGMLAGEQFQKVLPNFVRGWGGAGTVAISGAVLNPFLLLLMPLFSPRGVGKMVEKGMQGSPTLKGAASVAKKVAPLVGASTGVDRPSP